MITECRLPFCLFKSNPKFFTDYFAIMMHISASTAPIRMKQKPLYSKLNAESDKYYYNSLCKSLENPPESLSLSLSTVLFRRGLLPDHRFRFLQGKFGVCLQLLGQGKILYADHQSVAQHFLLQPAVFTKIDQFIEFGNVLLSGLALSLRPAVKLGPFKNNVPSYFKVRVELSHYGVVPVPVAIFFFGPSSHVTSPSFNEYSYCTCAVRLKREDLAGNTRLHEWSSSHQS